MISPERHNTLIKEKIDEIKALQDRLVYLEVENKRMMSVNEKLFFDKEEAAANARDLKKALRRIEYLESCREDLEEQLNK